MKYQIFLIIFTAFVFQGKSQSIANTKWKTFNSGLNDTITVEITSDTIYQYVRSDTMLTVSNYSQNSDTILLADVGGIFACLPTDTGMYKIDIIGDTLIIDLITDPCLSRSIVYNGSKLWRVDKPVGIRYSDDKITFRIFPNPGDGVVNIETKDTGVITIYNSQGQTIIQKETFDINHSLILQLRSGSYVVKYQTDEKVLTKRLIIN